MKRVIIVGAGASGKDYLKHYLETKGFTCSVSCTTRPARPGEVEGINYNFISEAEFLSMIDNNEFREWNKFAGKWYYGTTNRHFDAANLFIMTPSGIRALTLEDRMESLVIYIDVPEQVRRLRLMARSDADNPERRLDTDRIDFIDFKNFDWHITDPEFDLGELYSRIRDVMNSKNMEPIS